MGAVTVKLFEHARSWYQRRYVHWNHLIFLLKYVAFSCLAKLLDAFVVFDVGLFITAAFSWLQSGFLPSLAIMHSGPFYWLLRIFFAGCYRVLGYSTPVNVVYHVIHFWMDSLGEPFGPRKDTPLLLFMLAVTCSTFTGGAFALYLQIWERYRSQLPYRDPHVLRGAFNALPIPTVKPHSHHTHGLSAADRSTVSLFAEMYADSIGLVPYFYQRSFADVRKGRAGSRDHYWAKDLTCPESFYDPPPNALLVLIDVDPYVEMPEFMTTNFLPILIYTFQPKAVSAVDGEVAYTFLADGQATYSVTGGGKYTHKVWNYSQDHCIVTNGPRSFFNPLPISSAWLIDRQACADHHEVILLTPIARIATQPFFLRREIQGSPLTRFAPVDGDFLRLQFHAVAGFTVSTGRVGGHAQATVTKQVDEAIASSARTTKIFTLAHVEQHMEGKQRVAAQILFEYHQQRTPKYLSTAYPLEASVHHYQYESSRGYDFDAKPAQSPFMHPIIPGAYIPQRCRGNEEAAVRERVTNVASTIQPDTFTLGLMREFAEMLIPEPHRLHPGSLEEVWERQDRPTQRAIIDKANSLAFLKRTNQFFMKAESYGTTKPPRVISTVNPKDKVSYSQIIYAFGAVFDDQPWYAFSKKPSEIAARVAAVCSGAKSHVLNSDLSKFDGRLSPLLRQLELMLLQRAFHSDYADMIYELHSSQYGLPSYGPFGTNFAAGTARMSGSPETARMNTLCNTFIVFIALRMSRQDPQYLSPFLTAQQAFQRLGIYGGDDGLTADVSVEMLTQAAARVGQKTTCEPIQVGDLGVKFLARIYGPLVWFGNPSSCCDLPRQLVKFHVSGHLDVTPERKLMEKARSFYLSDANTPVLGSYCSAILSCTEEGTAKLPEPEVFARFGTSDNRPEIQYPNDNYDGWMFAYAERALPNADFGLWESWLDAVLDVPEDSARLQRLLSPIVLCHEVGEPEPIPPNVMVDGHIPEPKKHETILLCPDLVKNPPKIGTTLVAAQAPDGGLMWVDGLAKNTGTKKRSTSPTRPPPGHNDRFVRAPKVPNLAPGKAPAKPSRQACHQFLAKGSCNFGAACRYLHDNGQGVGT